MENEIHHNVKIKNGIMLFNRPHGLVDGDNISLYHNGKDRKYWDKNEEHLADIKPIKILDDKRVLVSENNIDAPANFSVSKCITEHETN